MKRLVAVAAREPVLLGGALLATAAIWHPSPEVLAALTAWVTLGQRVLSTPQRKAEQREREAHAKGAADLVELARAKRRHSLGRDDGPG